MDKIGKFIKRLSAKERKKVELVIIDILSNDLAKYDLKKMKGHANLYRVRIGDLRVVFIDSQKEKRVLLIDRRNDNTYKDF